MMLHLYLPVLRSITLLVSVCLLFPPRSGASGFSEEPKNSFPEMLRGDWFWWENGRGNRATIDESEYEGRGVPIWRRSVSPDVLDYIFQVGECRFCSRFLVRSWNIIERFDGPCHFRRAPRTLRSAGRLLVDRPTNASVNAERNGNPHNAYSQTSKAPEYKSKTLTNNGVPRISPKKSSSLLERDDTKKVTKIASSMHAAGHHIQNKKHIHKSERVVRSNADFLKTEHRKVDKLSTRAALSKKKSRPGAKLIETAIVRAEYDKRLDIQKLCSFLNDVTGSSSVSPQEYFQNASDSSAEFQSVNKMLDGREEFQTIFPQFLHSTESPENANVSHSRQPVEERDVWSADQAKVASKLGIDDEYLKRSSPEERRTVAPEQGLLMHRRNFVPVPCHTFLRGHYHMAWRDKRSSSALCIHPEAELTSCQASVERLTADAGQMTVVHRRCPGVRQSYDAEVSYSCLGSWHIGTRHYLAVANLRQRKEGKRYRCFLHDLTEPQLAIGVSKRPGCAGLSAADTSPELMVLTPVVPSVPSSCTLPPEYRGTWQGTGRGEPRVRINSTHIVTSLYRGPREVQVVHVCTQNRGKRFLLAAVPDNGCDVEYVCWEMLPRHHNIIRYRSGRHSNIASFDACDHRAFGSGRDWKYDTLIADPPDPVACPVRGRFSVMQEGSMPFVPRVLGGVTVAPLDTYPCKSRSPVWTVCDSRGYGSHTVVFDLDACTDLDYRGRPRVVKEVPDYEMLCAGHWQENLRSYLVTFSASDPVSRYRCWVYRRTSSQEVRLSASVGSACGLHQTHLSSRYNESAQVALSLKLEERMHDQCPMEFDLGRDPWASDHRRAPLPVVFRFRNNTGHRNFSCASYLLVIAFAVLLFY